MYDFYLGSDEEVKKDEKKFLLGIKRMLPRWCNSIPDSEYLAIYDILQTLDLKGKKPVLVETGAGASSIVLLHYAIKHGGTLFTWDTNGSKLAFLRSVIGDTLLKYNRKNLHDHWKFIAFDSNSEHLGISILKEMGKEINFGFFDSEHTLKVLLGEVSNANKVLADGGIITIDDSNYNYKYMNVAYINMFRKKLGLGPIENPSDNQGGTFGEEVEKFLKSKWNTVTHLRDTYKDNFKEDIFWRYYDLDRAVMGDAGMEKMEMLANRFDSWKVSGRKE